jgi:type IV secretion system protein VirB10
MPLPSLGRIDPPLAERPAASKDPAPQPTAPDVIPLPEIPLAAAPVQAAYGAPPAKTPAQLELERQLSGAVFSSQSSVPVAASGMPTLSGMPPSAVPGPQEPGELGALLRPGVTTAVHAQVLPTQRLLLPKGAFLDCTLETAIDSTLPGMTTCVMATDTFGVDGAVVLLERGTKLVGETRGQVQQGSARVFVLWNEARTPGGVIVPLASPGADELGRAGLPGTVDRHFWERFGAAMLVSVIDGAIQAAVQSSRGSSGTVIVNPSATQDVMTEVLKDTINIPPTVRKHQGDRIQVLVARDLDFRSVYELRSASAGR